MEIANRQNLIRVGNVPGGAMADLALRSDNPVLIICDNDRDLAEMAALVEFFAPSRSVLQLPAWDVRPYDRLSPHPSIAAQRASTLSSLAQGGADVVLTTVNALMQKLPKPTIMQTAALSIDLGHTLDIPLLHEFAQTAGYALVATVRGTGEYAVRGGIIDIFPAGFAAPIRLDLFGDTIDSIREFDPQSQRSGEHIQNVALAASGELILTPERISNFRDGYRAMVGVPARDDPFYEAVSSGIRPQGIEHMLPLFYRDMASIFDYLPENAVVYGRMDLGARVGERFAAITETQNMHQQDAKRAALIPDALYLDIDALDGAMKDFKTYLASDNPLPPGMNVIDAGFHSARDFAIERTQEGSALFDNLSKYIHKLTNTRALVIACASAGSAARMKSMLAEYDFENTIGPQSAASTRQGSIGIAVLPITAGFGDDNLEIISEADILGARLARKRKSRKSADSILSEASNLAIGQFVVHRDHGIGRFTGVQNITAGGAPHECLVLEYHNNDKLFVPVENIDVLSPYAEDTATPDRLGTAAWQERKARTKKDLLIMADGLMRLAAERNLRRAPVIEATPHEYDQFAARFPFNETDDQLLAIEETLADLASGKPMDRLVCGDVGFGKTEVALRAAYVTAMSGHQVAVIAPTTLLVRQHFRNFVDRFAGTGINIAQLSRFVGTAEAKLTKQAMDKGQIDIVIGTHALLSKDVRFKNLGFLIIDEEQHFGVKHKEKIKELRADVHVLTLSATPIPRTLQLALSGVRELSLIATPPVDRLAVRTYVAPFDKQMIRDALLREKLRGGQSFYVVPRVADLPEIQEFLAETCPEMRVITAHGQLAAGDLDQRVNDFYDGKADILLATTIVESGLDIPTANTLIVHRADMFGLAQLYQIRGRVGRAKLRAFAYLTTKARAVLNPLAEKRLRVLASLDELGSGFNLASHDLDMRGSGNLLGDAQSGQIREVGFALYQSMLKDAIAKMKAGDLTLHDDDDQFSPEISLGVAVMIPDEYVPDLDTRLGLYRRLARLRKKSEIEDFAAELIDRFGPLPPELQTLFMIVRIKAFARVAGISNLDAGPRGATLRFHRNDFANPKGLMEFIASEKGQVKIKDTRIVVLRDWGDDRVRITGALKIAAELAKIAKAIN